MDQNRSISSQEVEILLVEDNPGDIRLIEEALADARIVNTIHAVTEKQEALDFVHQCGEYTDVPQPDIVLLDWHLVRATGEEVLRAINTDPELRHIPVIVLTGSKQGEDIVETSEIQANAYLTKPVGPDDFLSLIRSFEFFWLTVIRPPPHL